MGKNFLLEIGCEELPSSYILPALDDLERLITDQLKGAELSWNKVEKFATPRRLTLIIEDLSEHQPEKVVLVRGPAEQAAFDSNGDPTDAALGFARAQGVELKDIAIRDTEKGRYLFVEKKIAGRSTFEILQEIVPEAIRKIRFPKRMRWGRTKASFARPVRWIVALFGNEVVPVQFAGIKADRKTRGHRFLAKEPVIIEEASRDEYESKLESAFVIPDFSKRRKRIAEEISAILEKYGGQLGADEEMLLNKVANLVEYPHCIEGAFPQRFLRLPEELVVACMEEHQHFFPVRDEAGHLLAHFITVRNGVGEGDDIVRTGNERVLVARLEDAEFFWTEDRKRSLEGYVEDLAGVIFQERLGSYLEKTHRLRELVTLLAESLGLGERVKKAGRRAAYLAKADLVTQVVTEFPVLQGVMGGIYAREDGEEEEIWRGLPEQYLPLQRGEKLVMPETEVGALLSVADKIDTIAGCFGIGLVPSGSQDPYALRRQAIGIIRILLDRGWDIDLGKIFEEAAVLYADRIDKACEDVLEEARKFFAERLRAMMLEEGFAHDLIEVILETGVFNPVDAYRRLRALDMLKKEDLPAFVRTAVVAERTTNILKGADSVPQKVDTNLFQMEEEEWLWEIYLDRAKDIVEKLERKEYISALRQYGEIFFEPVHIFFDRVLVNVDDEKLRMNRLALNKAIRDIMHGYFDMSKIVLTDELRQKAGIGNS